MTLDDDISGMLRDLDSIGAALLRLEEMAKGTAETLRLQSRLGESTHRHVEQMTGSMRHIAEISNQMEVLANLIDRIADKLGNMSDVAASTQASVGSLVTSVDKHWSEMVQAVTGKRQGDWWPIIVLVGGLIAVIVFLSLRISDKNFHAQYGDKGVTITNPETVVVPKP